MKKPVIILLLFTALLFAKGTVCIAVHDSEFKTAIAQQIADSLENDSITVVTIPLKELKEKTPTDYTAVIIINTCHAWTMSGSAKNFFRNHPTYNKVVLITTSAKGSSCGKDRKIPEYVDAISSASEESRITPIVEKALKQIHIFLETENH